MMWSPIAALATLAFVAASPIGDRDGAADRISKRGYWNNEEFVGYSKDGDLNCRQCPSTQCNAVSWYDRGGEISITCQTEGQAITANTVWEKTSRGCYVADNRVKTGYLWIPNIPRCTDVPPIPE